MGSFALTNLPPGDITLTSASVGQNLEAPISLSLSQSAPIGNNPPGLAVTLTSADPSKLLLAGRPGDAGTASLLIIVPENQTSIGGIYVQGLVSSGSVLVTASAANFNSGTATISLTPSGITLAGPSGPGTAFSANLGSNTVLTLSSVQLDSDFNIVQGQQVRGGFSVSVPVTSSSSSVGTITTSPVTFNGGDSLAGTQFHAAAVGSTTLSATAPLGFSVLIQGGSMTATVDPATLSPGNVTVGKNLETTAQVGFNGTVPAGGLIITITSDNPSQMLLSASPTAAGSASIMLNAPFNAHTSPVFYVQGLADSGTVTYTASMPGFGSNTGTVTLAPSGFVIAGPTGLAQTSFLDHHRLRRLDPYGLLGVAQFVPELRLSDGPGGRIVDERGRHQLQHGGRDDYLLTGRHCRRIRERHDSIPASGRRLQYLGCHGAGRVQHSDSVQLRDGERYYPGHCDERRDRHRP